MKMTQRNRNHNNLNRLLQVRTRRNITVWKISLLIEIYLCYTETTDAGGSEQQPAKDNENTERESPPVNVKMEPQVMQESPTVVSVLQLLWQR